MSSLALNSTTFREAVDTLRNIDPMFDMLVKRCGYPKMVQREANFPSLMHIILEQQVSLASAQATFDKLGAHVVELTPETFLPLTDEKLRDLGFSRQKTAYGRGLAQALVSRELVLENLAHLPDEDVHNELVKLKGIGRWTTDVYLMMALGRPDIWPVGDLALVVAMQKLKKLEKRPGQDAMMEYGEPWRPFRSVAAHILWTFYLSPGFKRYQEEG
ncbi:MAG: DNA-3-methyladenine glycosylase family protein [Calditrichia bacterium]